MKTKEALINEVREWANFLVMREYCGPGQMERALDRASMKTGVDRGILWSLRYRPTTEIFASAYFQLKAAYEAECERQERLLSAERQITRDINAAIESKDTASD